MTWTYVINDLNAVEIIETFYENELQKTIKKEFRIEKLIKRKSDKLYVKWKGYNNSFDRWVDKKDSINEWIFSKTNFLGANIQVKLHLSYYATKADLKNATGVDTSSLAKTTVYPT